MPKRTWSALSARLSDSALACPRPRAEERRIESRQDYRNAWGMVVTEHGRIPETEDAFDVLALPFERVDMDRLRVDKVLTSPVRMPAGDTVDMD